MRLIVLNMFFLRFLWDFMVVEWDLMGKMMDTVPSGNLR